MKQKYTDCSNPISDFIVIRDLSVEYPGGHRALEGITLKIRQGESTVLLGRSGAGKSTLLRCLNLLQKPTTGSIWVNGIGDLTERLDLRDYRRQTGMVFQLHHLISRQSALQNVLMGRLAYHATIRSLFPLPEGDIAVAMECLERVGLADKALKRADQLSGGERQRVGIARALAQRPKIILAIELHVLTSYAAMIEATRNGRIDLAFFGPLSYCMAKDKAAIEPFAAKIKDGTATYKSVIIAGANSGVEKPEDIRGKRMAYGDQASTSSHLIPKGVLAQRGIKPADYQESFLGKHDAVALNVMRGNVDAGGLSQVIFASLVEKGTIDKTKVKVVAESDPIPEYPWVMQTDLATALREEIRKAFLELKDPAILKPLKADGFASIKDSDYDVIRNAAKILGLDLGSLEK